MDGSSMILLVKQSGIDGALDYMQSIRGLLLEDPKQRLFLILTNMQGIIASQRKKKRVDFWNSNNRQESIRPFTRDLLTELYLRLTLWLFLGLLTPRECNVSCFPCESSNAVIDWVQKLMEAVRNSPYLCHLSWVAM